MPGYYRGDDKYEKVLYKTIIIIISDDASRRVLSKDNLDVVSLLWLFFAALWNVLHRGRKDKTDCRRMSGLRRHQINGGCATRPLLWRLGCMPWLQDWECNFSAIVVNLVQGVFWYFQVVVHIIRWLVVSFVTLTDNRCQVSHWHNSSAMANG